MAADITQGMTVMSLLTDGGLPDVIAADFQLSATILDMDGFRPGAGGGGGGSTRPTTGMLYPRGQG